MIRHCDWGTRISRNDLDPQACQAPGTQEILLVDESWSLWVCPRHLELIETEVSMEKVNPN